MYRATFFAVLSVVTIFMLIPLPAGGEPLVNDKIAHAAVFLLLSALIHTAYRDTRFLFSLASILLLYGILIELLQGWTGYRTFSVFDIIADTVGICIYILILKTRLIRFD